MVYIYLNTFYRIMREIMLKIRIPLVWRVQIFYVESSMVLFIRDVTDIRIRGYPHVGVAELSACVSICGLPR